MDFMVTLIFILLFLPCERSLNLISTFLNPCGSHKVKKECTVNIKNTSCGVFFIALLTFVLNILEFLLKLFFKIEEITKLLQKSKKRICLRVVDSFNSSSLI